MLASHRGYDAGALVMAQELAQRLDVPLVGSTVSRLLVDLNRSLGHPKVYSSNIQSAPVEIRASIVGQYYQPYRTEVETRVRRGIELGCRVVHVSCHSFTPQLDGLVRNCDVGLLYDPARHGEVGLSKAWQEAIQTASPHCKVRRNYPYAGKNDGLTTTLRRRHSAEEYVGIELELNQKLVVKPARRWENLRVMLIESLLRALEAG